MNSQGPWIMHPFNGVFFACFALFLLLLVLAGVCLRGKSERTKKTVLVTACVLTLLGFFVYKYFLSIDAEFNEATAAMGGFNWWGELPLQLCNINMILIPIAVLTNRRALMSFAFFVGPLGALMALVMPGTGFDGYSILLPRMLGYYGTHFMVIIEALALAVFGLYRPRFRDRRWCSSRSRCSALICSCARRGCTRRQTISSPWRPKATRFSICSTAASRTPGCMSCRAS